MRLDNEILVSKDEVDKDEVDKDEFDKDEVDKNKAESYMIADFVTLAL